MADWGCVIGIDYGTDSVRAVIVEAADGSETSSAVVAYPRWKAGRYCDPAENRFRQHPRDYIEGLEQAVRGALDTAPSGTAARVRGIAVDTTGSTPGPVDRNGRPLALLPEFEHDPDAMFILWKDHTSVTEAEEINTVARSWGGTDFTIVGIVEPKLFTTAADAYLPLATLQKIAGRDGQINSLLLKATNAKNVAQAGESTAALFTDAKVTDAAETAKQVSGSLVSAANLTNRFIGLTTIIVIVACLAIVSLLTVSSVNKRVREIGTLKAIGWSNGLVVRQIVLENIVIGLLGAIVGVGLGLIGLYVVNRFNISLSATIAGTDVGKSIMRRFMGGETADITTSVQLKVMISWLVLSLGAGVALLGSVVAATFASLKASRMKPQEALRNIE